MQAKKTAEMQRLVDEANQRSAMIIKAEAAKKAEAKR